jgi:quinol monooxygenase YgiN
MSYTVLAEIEAKPDRIKWIAEQIGILVEVSRREPGCLKYDAFQHEENQAQFMIFESWENKAAWDQHMQMAALTAYLQATEGCTLDVAVRGFVPLSEAGLTS